MAVGIVDRQKLVNIADAVRAKKGITGNMTLDAIASNITSIPTADNNAKFDFTGSGSKSSGNLTKYLTSIDLTGLDTSNYTSMSNMFDGCLSLTSLDVSSFNTSKVTNMNSMFQNCSSLTSLDLSNFDTSKVGTEGYGASFVYMFQDCSSLKYLDISSFDLSNTYSGEYYSLNKMFSGCKSLKTLKLPNSVSFKKTDIYLKYMFYNCSSLTSLDFTGWDTTNVVSMNNMFSGCSSLTSLDLSSFNTSKVTDIGNMFSGCSSLTSLDLSNWNTSNLTVFGSMFDGCLSLTSLDLSSFNTSKVKSMYYMFNKCSSLTSLDLSSFDTSNITNMEYMFQYCSKLSNLTLGNDWASNSSIKSFDLSSCPLTRESAVDVINKLATRSNSPVIKFSNTVGLYQSEIDIATNKGWSVSGCIVLVES